MMIALIRTLCWLVLACLLAGGRAEAHASLIESNPADGAVVTTAPVDLRLRFNEPVAPLVLRLVDAKGTAHDLRHEARSETVTVHLPAELPRGTQVLSYRVISADGHPVGGSLVFSIGAPTAARSEPAQTDTPLATAIWLMRLALYLGLFAGTGGAFFSTWVGGEAATPASRTVGRLAIGIGIVAAVLSLGLQGLDALGDPLPALLSPHPWHAGLTTSFGFTVVAAIVSLVFAWIALRGRYKMVALVGLGGAGLALALSGHASSASPQWLTRLCVFVHGTAVAYWVGALMPLALLVRERRCVSWPIVQRFSANAVPAVGLMVAAGVVLSVIQIETPQALLSTAYGRVFLAKMAAVALVLALAAFNRQRLTPMLRSQTSGAKYLFWSILGEIALAVLILGLVATWRFTLPPRALLSPPPKSVSTHIHTSAAMADLTLTPGHVGPVTATISLMSGDFGTLDPKEVTISLANKGSGIEPIERRANRAADGTWQAEAVVLPVPGPWQVRIDALLTDFEKTTLEGTVEISR